MEKSQEFWALVARHEKILLVTHQQADIDAVASVLALKYLIENQCPQISVKCFFNGFKGFSLKIFKDFNLRENQAPPPPQQVDLCILVDTNSFQRVGGGDFFEKYVGDRMIIDHHSPSDAPPQDVIFSFIDPSHPSCVEIIYQFIPNEHNLLPITIRRAMVAGLFTDTRSLTLCDSRSFQILATLLGTDLKLGDVTALFQEEFTSSEKIARLKGAQRATLTRVGSWTIIVTEVSSFEAQVANGLVSLGADLCLVVSKQKGGNSRIIARASPNLLKTGKINFGELFQNIQAAEIESAGGHGGAAGISLNGQPEDVLKEILNRVQFLLDER